MHNYWCNLLNENAVNGAPNPARPIAITALLMQALALASFWFLFPLFVSFKRMGRLIIQAAGVLCVLIGAFLSTPWHDIIIDVSTLAGLVALIGTFVGLYKLRWKKMFGMGLFILVLIALNNWCYYSGSLIYYLPLVQKITFLYVLSWICLICLLLYRQPRISH
jgi:hypothetical protein